MSWQDYTQITRRALRDLGKLIAGTLWGFGYKKRELHQELIEFKAVAELLRNQELSGGVCICPEEEALIRSHIHRVVGPECKTGEKDFHVADRADLPRYLSGGEACVQYENYADYLAAQCQRIGINFTVVEKKCADVGINIRVTDAVIMCALDLAFDIQEKVCDIDFAPNVTLQECVIDLATQVIPKTCDLDLKTTLTEIACGVDLNTIIQEHQCDVDLDVEAGECTTDEATAGEVTFVLADFEVTADDTTVCYYTDVVLSVPTPQYPDVVYTWDFGSGASPATAEGDGPFTIQYTTAGSKTVTVTATLGDQIQQDTIGITVSSCPGQMIGTVEDTVGNPLVNYNFRLYSDANQDGVADSGTPVKNIFSNGAGSWSMASLTPGHYILEANFIDDDVTFEDLGDQDGIVDTLTAATPVVAGNKAVKVQIRPSQIQGVIQVIVDLT